MNKIIITIETDNAAFHDSEGNFDPAYELNRILKGIASKLYEGYKPENINIMDINGNNCGKIEVK